MPSTSYLENLPLDVCDSLLISIPDLASLRNAVLSCQTLHDTYVLRKKFITDAIIYRQVGPCMHLALVVLRGLDDVTKHREGVNETRAQISNKLNDRGSAYWDQEYTPGEIIRVGREISPFVDDIETEFSLRCVEF